MSERELKICRRHSSRDEWVPLDDKPNSEAPSVAEVSEVLHDLWHELHAEKCTNVDDCESFGKEGRCSCPKPEILARLEGAPDGGGGQPYEQGAWKP